jgi:hypothetical protein
MTFYQFAFLKIGLIIALFEGLLILLIIILNNLPLLHEKNIFPNQTGSRSLDYYKSLLFELLQLESISATSSKAIASEISFKLPKRSSWQY